jgi:hypothetical protein
MIQYNKKAATNSVGMLALAVSWHSYKYIRAKVTARNRY